MRFVLLGARTMKKTVAYLSMGTLISASAAALIYASSAGRTERSAVKRAVPAYGEISIALPEAEELQRPEAGPETAPHRPEEGSPERVRSLPQTLEEGEFLEMVAMFDEQYADYSAEELIAEHSAVRVATDSLRDEIVEQRLRDGLFEVTVGTGSGKQRRINATSHSIPMGAFSSRITTNDDGQAEERLVVIPIAEYPDFAALAARFYSLSRLVRADKSRQTALLKRW